MRYVPTEKACDWARAREGPKGEPIFEGRNYWMGFLGEWYFAVWLKEQGIEFQHNGGRDPLPDFVVADVGVGVKTAGSRREWGPELYVQLWDAHRKSSPDQLFFVGHVGLEQASAVVMLGGLAVGDFFRRADFIPIGADLVPGLPSLIDTWRLRVRHLTPPEEWLAQLRS